MNPFAKIFETKKFGQVLVVIDTDDEDDPVVKITARYSFSGGIMITLGFNSAENKKTAARYAFNKIDQKTVNALFKQYETFWIHSKNKELIDVSCITH